jgi:hypothetical protein
VLNILLFMPLGVLLHHEGPSIHRLLARFWPVDGI